MAESVDSVVLQLEARVGQYNTAIADAASSTEKNLARIQVAASDTEKSVGLMANNSRISSQIMVRAIKGAGDQFAAGAPPLQIFTTHLGELAEAGIYAGGSLGKFGAFLGGPWGIAAAIGAQVLLPLIANLLETSSALDEVEKHANSAIKSLEGLGGAGTAGKIAEATGQLTRLTEQQLQLQRDIANPHLIFQRGTNQQRLYSVNQQILAAQDAITKGGNELEKENKPPKSPRERHPRESHPREGAAGPDPAQIDRRFNDQLAQYGQQALSAMEQMAGSAEEEAELRLRSVELTRVRNLKAVDDDKAFDDAQKARLRAQIESTAEHQREAIAFREQVRTEEEAQRLAETRHQAATDALQQQYDLARTDEQRHDIALQILDADDAYLRSKLEAVEASKTATKAEKDNAAIMLAALNNTAAPRRALVDLQHEGPLARYADSLADPKTRVEAAVAKELQAVNDGITQALADKLGIKDQLVKDLFSIFLDNVVFKPLAEALSSASGGLGGFLGNVIGAVFGGHRAAGGPVSAGGAYLVGERGPELIVPHSSGMVIPNDRLAGGGGATVVQHIHVDARNSVNPTDFAKQILSVSGQQAQQAAAQMGQRFIKAVPQRMASYQRDGF